jgi:hypothetical protein
MFKSRCKEELVHLMANKAQVSVKDADALLDAFTQTVREEVAKGLYWLLRLSVLTSGKKQSSRNPFHHLPGVWMTRTWE